MNTFSQGMETFIYIDFGDEPRKLFTFKLSALHALILLFTIVLWTVLKISV